ncbi:MAG: MBL fold metallo-hydrolase [Thermodesulfobacteriota bacterium]
MSEEVSPNLFRIQIPLPDNPLKFVNSYVIKGPDQTLVVDTGLNREECLAAMKAGLKELAVELDRVAFFITHLHADHFGLVARLAARPDQIYFSRPETEIIESWTGWEPMVQYAARNGFPEDLLRAALNSHPGYKYSAGWVPGMKILSDGDPIDIGDYHFVCVVTPGHTRGHICLYEPRKKILISGDHVLGDITPNIQCWSDVEDPLKDYLASLDKVGRLEVDLTLPGHRSLIHDLYHRIEELKEHHHHRADEVLTILRHGPRHAFDTAAGMTWDLAGAWDDFPLAQKWFATAEATAHLRYLEEAGEVYRETGEGKIIYHC